MVKFASGESVETLIEQARWKEARALIEQQLQEDSQNHWLLTQLGVTHYEEGQHREALRPLLASLEIVPDCPLTLWNIAGALDASGNPERAIPIYTWLIRSKKTRHDDECWESAEWTDSLKTDCVYRLGICFQHLKKWESAENCFRQYINLLLAGMSGLYSADDAARRIRELAGKGKRKLGKQVRDAFGSTLQDAGLGRGGLPQLSTAELLVI